MINKSSLSETEPADAPNDGASVRRFTKARPLAARLGINAKTLFRWAEAGKIARFKVNARVVLFDESEVIAFIESARVDGRKGVAP